MEIAWKQPQPWWYRPSTSCENEKVSGVDEEENKAFTLWHIWASGGGGGGGDEDLAVDKRIEVFIRPENQERASPSASTGLHT